MLRSVYKRGESLPERRNNAYRSITAPVLSIPKLSADISDTIGLNDTNDEEINLLHFLSEFLPVRSCLKKSPAETLANVIETWSSPLLKTAQRYFDFSIGIVSQNAIDRFFETDARTSYDTHLVVKINNFRDFSKNLGNAIMKLDIDYPGLGKWLMKLFNESPITIGSPGIIYEMATYLFWDHEDDEKCRLDDLRSELHKDHTEEEFQQYAEDFLPVRYGDFEKIFPKWAFDRQERHIVNYTDPMPDIIESLHLLYKKMHQPIFSDITYICPDNDVPAFAIIWSDDSYDLSARLINESANMIYQIGYGAALSPVAMRFRYTREHIEFFTLILNYFEQSIKVLEWLAEGELS